MRTLKHLVPICVALVALFAPAAAGAANLIDTKTKAPVEKGQKLELEGTVLLFSFGGLGVECETITRLEAVSGKELTATEMEPKLGTCIGYGSWFFWCKFESYADTAPWKVEVGSNLRLVEPEFEISSSGCPGNKAKVSYPEVKFTPTLDKNGAISSLHVSSGVGSIVVAEVSPPIKCEMAGVVTIAGPPGTYRIE